MQQEKQKNYKMNSNFHQAEDLPQEEVVLAPIRKPIVVLGVIMGAVLSYVNTFVDGQLMLMTIVLFGAVMIFGQMGSRSVAKGLPIGMMVGGVLSFLFFIGLIVYQKATGGGVNLEAVLLDMGKAVWAIFIGFLVKRAFVR